MSIELERQQRFIDFLDWFKKYCNGKERAQGQIFFNKLLQAFGNAGVLEAGAVCEDTIKKKSGKTGFADLVWRPRVIIELKERGTNLKKHYPQAEEYWMRLVPNRPQFMILCNFDEFWIYDLNTQLNDPVHVLKIENLQKDYGALSFLFPQAEKPIFNNNNVEVTEEAAKIVGEMYLSLQNRRIDQHQAQRFVLQLVVALFAEDVGLIPKYTLQKILREAVKNPVTQKELTELFQAMATDQPSKKTKKYKDIPYFNGGLFKQVESFELKFTELDLLAQAADQDWSKVRPSIFGAIFESSMDQEKRHGHGVHFTSELDIQKIVNPTIVRPFRERIEKAKNKKELAVILDEIQHCRVLDPACGSGNFLYIAFRELRRLEIEIYERMEKNFNPQQMRFGLISPKNFYGIDTNEFGLELAKVALSIGRKLSADEFGIADNVLPFDNLDENFIGNDALFSKWPDADYIIGNPPFLSQKDIRPTMGEDYVASLKKKYPTVSGKSDYCAFWFRKAHDQLKENGRAGLVGTNTIRQNNTREASLDHICKNGGEITEAVSSQVWSGDAVVHVSIVNWIKGEDSNSKKKLYKQIGNNLDSDWEVYEVDKISTSLSPETDVTAAMRLDSNQEPQVCFQGQIHGHEGFLLSSDEYKVALKKDSKLVEVAFPYLIGDELVGTVDRKPKRYVIDFQEKSLTESMKYPIFKKIEMECLPDLTKKADAEKKTLKGKTGPRQSHMNKWFKLWCRRPELIKAIANIDRYIACSRVTKNPIFDFVSNGIHPSDVVQVFAFQDDYSFGVISSVFHALWFQEKCSTMKSDPRYTSKSVWDTFPWPQSPSVNQVHKIAEMAREVRRVRNKIAKENNWSLRQVYRTLDLPGKNELLNAHKELDEAVRVAYGFSDDDYLGQLLALNLKLYSREQKNEFVEKPGIPLCIKNVTPLISRDCISV